MGMLAEREKRLLRTVTGGGQASAPSPIQARKATNAICWRVRLLNGSNGAPSRAALIVFISGVLPTLCTAGHEASIPDRSRGFETISVVAPQRARLARNPISLGNRPAMSRYSSAGRIRLALALSQGCQLSLFQDIPRLIDGLRTRPAPAWQLGRGDAPSPREEGDRVTAKTAKSAPLGWSGMFRGVLDRSNDGECRSLGLCCVRCRIGRPGMVVS